MTLFHTCLKLNLLTMLVSLRVPSGCCRSFLSSFSTLKKPLQTRRSDSDGASGQDHSQTLTANTQKNTGENSTGC